jgi:hypothetical protein
MKIVNQLLSFGACLFLGAVFSLLLSSRNTAFEGRIAALERDSQAQSRSLESIDRRLSQVASDLAELGGNVMARVASSDQAHSNLTSSAEQITFNQSVQSSVRDLESAMDVLESDVENLKLAMAVAANTNHSPVLLFHTHRSKK